VTASRRDLGRQPPPHYTGLPSLARNRHIIPIDKDWLREQYLDRKRSTADIAVELGVSQMTINRAAHRYGIPIRPAGVASHPAMIRSVGDDVPRDIRRAVEGGLSGWQRLYRFQQAMAFPTIDAAADHLDVYQSVLVKQLQRLELDIGAQLCQRAKRALSMKPTRRGAALLVALARTDVRSRLD
jgi:hypothetical protein